MLVLDCCAAIEVVRHTDTGNWMQPELLKADKIISSSLFPAEVSNALRGCVRAGVLDVERARECAEIAISLVDEYVDTQENAFEALAESIRLEHPAYDLFYFTLARRNACPLVTADAKLARICARNGVSCIFFGNTQVPLENR